MPVLLPLGCAQGVDVRTLTVHRRILFLAELRFCALFCLCRSGCCLQSPNHRDLVSISLPKNTRTACQWRIEDWNACIMGYFGGRWCKVSHLHSITHRPEEIVPILRTSVNIDIYTSGLPARLWKALWKMAEIWECLLMKLTADQYFLYYLRASDVQSLSYSSFFLIIRQPSWFSTDNAKFKRKYCEQAVQMYLCQWVWSTLKCKRKTLFWLKFHDKFNKFFFDW